MCDFVLDACTLKHTHTQRKAELSSPAVAFLCVLCVPQGGHLERFYRKNSKKLVCICVFGSLTVIGLLLFEQGVLKAD